MNIKLLLILIVSFFQISQAQEEWQLEKDKNGIVVYTRRGDGTKLKEYKGITVVDAPIKRVSAFINNVPEWEKVMYKCKEGTPKVLKQVSKNEYYAYMEISSPFPASNRDVIVLYTNHSPENDGSILIEFKAQPNFIPEKKGIVRVPEVDGYWKLIPVSDTKTKVIHQSLSSPGGKVPAGLANTAAVEAPYSTLEKLKAILEK
jgi:hypothetical protein